MHTSIIIPTRDEELLEHTLQSVQESVDSDVELIVVDDGDTSCEDTAIFNGAAYVRNGKPLGCPKSRMVGASFATGRYIAFIDAHMTFPHRWLEDGLAQITERDIACFPTVAHAGGKAGYGSTLHLARPHFLDATWNLECPEGSGQVGCVMGGCYLMDRAWFDRIGGFDGIEQLYFCEQFLSLKCRMAGGDCICVNTDPIVHMFNEPCLCTDHDTRHYEIAKIAHILGLTRQQMADRMLRGKPVYKAFDRLDVEATQLPKFVGDMPFEDVEAAVGRLMRSEPTKGYAVRRNRS